jgi:sodium-dependent dicarboxylate transporter 2/3/5
MSVAEAISEAEERFEARRKRAGLVLAPLVFVGLWLASLPALTAEAHALSAVAAAIVVLWITEAIPLAVAALLAPTLAVLCGAAAPKAAFAPFADPLIFLFLGGFLLAEGLARQGVDRRAALWLISRRFVAGSPVRAMLALAGVSWTFSMWLSNTATTAMLLPVALGMHATMAAVLGGSASPLHTRLERFSGGMCLLVAYAASIGGIATPVGTGPNVLAIGMLEEKLGVGFDFAAWMTFAVPISTAMFIAAAFVIARRFPPPLARVEGLADVVTRQLAELGPARPGELRAVAVFGLAIVGWLAPSVLRLGVGAEHPWTVWAAGTLDEGVVALACASLLFVLPGSDARPILQWSDAARVDWGTLMLLGGGLALGRLTFETGLAEAIGRGVLGGLGAAGQGSLGLTICAIALMLVLTEVTSNTAVTSMMLPVLIGIATAGGIDPVPTAVLATIAASCAFMLPVSTPPNAMAYGTRLVRVDAMLASGVRLDVLGLVVLVVAAVLMT